MKQIGILLFIIIYIGTKLLVMLYDVFMKGDYNNIIKLRYVSVHSLKLVQWHK